MEDHLDVRFECIRVLLARLLHVVNESFVRYYLQAGLCGEEWFAQQIVDLVLEGLWTVELAW